MLTSVLDFYLLLIIFIFIIWVENEIFYLVNKNHMIFILWKNISKTEIYLILSVLLIK